MEHERQNYWLQSRTYRVNRRRLLQGTAVLGAGAASIPLVGCGDDDDDDGGTNGDGGGGLQTPTPAPTAPVEQVDTDAELRVGYGSFPSNLDAMTAAGQGGQAASNVYHYDTLFGYTAGRQITAGLAEFEFREDNTVFRIKARPNVEFHNGEPLDAEALKFYFDRTLGRAEYNPNFPAVNKARASWMGDISIVDNLTIDIKMPTPFVDAAEQSGGGNFSLAPRKYIIENGDDHYAQNPVGCGPMKFVSWVPDQEIRSERFDKYPFDRNNPFNGKQASWSKTLVARLIPEEQARLAALEAGEIDIAYRVGPDLAKSFQGRDGYKVFVLPDTRVMQIELPISWTTDPRTGGPNPWRDKRVRQAANYAIDVESIVKNLLTGNEARSFAPFPPGYEPPLGSLPAQYNYDPGKAKALLEEAGRVGFEFELLLATGLWTGDRVWAAAVQQMLNDVGFKCSVNYMPFSEALVLMRNHETKGPFVFNQGGAPKGGPYDPLFAWQLITTTDAPYSHTVTGDDVLAEHQEFLDLVGKAKSEFDAKKRNDLFYEAAKIHYENAFAVYLFNLSHLYVTRANIDYTEYYDVPTGMNLMAVKKLRA